MENNYSEALVEVNEVLRYTDPNLTCKIPNSFKKYILDHMSKTYKFSLSEIDNPNDITLKIETKTILGLIYRNYFCTAEEKQHLLQLEEENLLKQNIYNQDSRTNIDIVFDNNTISEKNSVSNSNINITNETNSNIIQAKQKWYIRLLENLLNKLKGLN